MRNAWPALVERCSECRLGVLPVLHSLRGWCELAQIRTTMRYDLASQISGKHQEALALHQRARAHPVLDTGAIVPAAAGKRYPPAGRKCDMPRRILMRFLPRLMDSSQVVGSSNPSDCATASIVTAPEVC